MKQISIILYLLFISTFSTNVVKANLSDSIAISAIEWVDDNIVSGGLSRPALYVDGFETFTPPLGYKIVGLSIEASTPGNTITVTNTSSVWRERMGMDLYIDGIRYGNLDKNYIEIDNASSIQIRKLMASYYYLIGVKVYVVPALTSISASVSAADKADIANILKGTDTSLTLTTLNNVLTNSTDGLAAIRTQLNKLDHATFGLGAIRTQTDLASQNAVDAKASADNANAKLTVIDGLIRSTKLSADAAANNTIYTNPGDPDDGKTVAQILKETKSMLLQPKIVSFKGYKGASATKTNVFQTLLIHERGTDFRYYVDGVLISSAWTPIPTDGIIPINFSGPSGLVDVMIEIRNSNDLNSPASRQSLQFFKVGP